MNIPYIEKDCTINFEGKPFESGGAVVTDEIIIGYPYFEKEFVGAVGALNSWHGQTIGTCKIVSI